MNDVIKVYNETTGQSVTAHILRQTPDILRVAINGNPLTMIRVSVGVYEGRIAGMTLTTQKPLR